MTDTKKRQEWFDAVWKHFVVDKAPASYGLAAGSHSRGCYYRGKNGERCAIGVLIPDDVYDSGIEGASPDTHDFWAYRGIEELFEGEEHAEFLRHLQDCHDLSARGCGDFHALIEMSLRKCAIRYNLSVPETTAND